MGDTGFANDIRFVAGTALAILIACGTLRRRRRGTTEHTALYKDLRAEAKVFALGGIGNVQAVGIIAGARFHVVQIAEQDEIVPALFRAVGTRTVNYVVELVPVVFNARGGGHITRTFPADLGAILRLGSRKDSKVRAVGIVCAKWFCDIDAKAFEIVPDVPRPVEVHLASQIIAANLTVVWKIPGLPIAFSLSKNTRAGGGHFGRSHREAANYEEREMVLECHFFEIGWTDRWMDR